MGSNLKSVIINQSGARW